MDLAQAYQILGLDPKTTSPDIAKKRFRVLVRETHPDVQAAHRPHGSDVVSQYILAYRTIESVACDPPIRTSGEAMIERRPLRYRGSLELYPKLRYERPGRSILEHVRRVRIIIALLAAGFAIALVGCVST